MNPVGLRRRHHEIWVGVFVLAGVLAIVFALFLLTDPATFRGRYHVTALVGNAAGIRRGDAVQMRGVNIGRVRAFSIRPDGVAIRLELENDFAVPADSRVVLRASGILGEMVAEVLPGTASERLRGGEVLPGSKAQGALGTVGDIAEQATGALESIQALLSSKTVENVETSTTELVALLGRVSALAADLRGVARNLGETTGGVRDATAGPELANTLRNLDELTTRLNDVAASIDVTAAQSAMLLARINRGEGSLGKLVRDEALYVNANQAMASLNQAAAALTRLAEDVQKRPGRYVNISVF